MKNVFKVVIYSMTTDGLDEYCDDYSGILYDTSEEARPELEEARRYFPAGAFISNEIIED